MKYVGKNYDTIFSSEAQKGLAFTSGAFISINQVLNAKHHRRMHLFIFTYICLTYHILEERQWAIVDEAVAQSIRILKDMEKFNIATAESVKQLESLWPQVDKSEPAFSHKNVRPPLALHLL